MNKPSGEDSCKTCGKPLSSATSITQWISLGDKCSCGFSTSQKAARPRIELSRPDPVTFGEMEEVYCSVCRKPVRITRAGSFTGWIFQPSSCECTIRNQLASAAGIGETIDSGSATAFPEISDRYKLQRLIARGGMSLVYQALDQHLDKYCVVKVLGADWTRDGISLQRFGQEARACAQFNHPNLISVTDYGVSGSGRPFLVMDFIEGSTLRSIIHAELLPVNEALAILLQVLLALEYAHGHNVIHRDIKPENVLITKDLNGNPTVKLLDFGIARCHDSHGEIQRLTQTGEVLGSPDYVSPEQCSGEPIDLRSDIYSFGCLMYELLTGRPPFRGSSLLNLLEKHVSEQVVPPEKVLNGQKLPHSLNAVVLKCLQKDPCNRFQSVPEVRSELVKIKNRQAKLTRSRLLTMTALFLLVGLVVGTRALAPTSVSSKREPDARTARLATAFYMDRAGLDEEFLAELQDMFKAKESTTCEKSALALLIAQHANQKSDYDTVIDLVENRLKQNLFQDVSTRATTKPAFASSPAPPAPLIYFYLGRAYDKKQNNLLARQAFYKCVELTEILKSPSWVRAKASCELGESLLYKEPARIDKAIEYLDKGVGLWEKSDVSLKDCSGEIISAYKDLAKAAQMKGREELAAAYLKKAAGAAERSGAVLVPKSAN